MSGAIDRTFTSLLFPYDIRMSKRDVRRARELVGDHFGKLVGLWEKFNG
jgi:hypothetical protein